VLACYKYSSELESEPGIWRNEKNKITPAEYETASVEDVEK
jgi:hypothetical protein